jgi:hypothetical protein
MGSFLATIGQGTFTSEVDYQGQPYTLTGSFNVQQN